MNGKPKEEGGKQRHLFDWPLHVWAPRGFYVGAPRKRQLAHYLLFTFHSPQLSILLISVMSATTKHTNGTDDADRPAKKARVDPEEDEEELAYVPTKAQTEPQKASDLYLDTVRTYCHDSTVQVL